MQVFLPYAETQVFLVHVSQLYILKLMITRVYKTQVIHEILYFLISSQQIPLWQIFKELNFHKFELRVKFEFQRDCKLLNIFQTIVGNFGLNKLWVWFITHKQSSQGFELKTSQNSPVKKIHRDLYKNSISIMFISTACLWFCHFQDNV